MAKAKQPVSIDGIEFDALIDQSMNYEAEVPEYPTEKGFSVSDNISLKPETLTMTLYVSDTPVTWKKGWSSSRGRVEQVTKKLQELYFAKKIVSVVTSEATFENMAITSLSIAKSPNVGYAREIPISLKKVIVTESKTTTIPDSYGKSGATAESAGTTSVSEASTGSGDYGVDEYGTDSISSSSSSGGSSYSSGSSSTESNGSILYNVATNSGLF